MKTWYTAKLFYHLVRVASRPQDTASGLAIAESMYKLGLLRAEAEQVCRCPEARALVAQRTLLPKLDLAGLNRLPSGTLGREYSDHMLKENLSPDFFKILDIQDDETFIMMRLRQTHDLWHTLTGFGTSVPEELGLQAFMMAQVHSPLAPIVIGGGLFAAVFKRPGQALEILDRVCRGWQMGVRAKPVFALDWPAHWQTPLVELRAKYGVI